MQTSSIPGLWRSYLGGAFPDAASRRLHAQIFHTLLLPLRTLGMESGRKDVETKIEKVEGTRERMARGIQNRVLMKSLKKELIMIYRLKCQGFGY